MPFTDTVILRIQRSEAARPVKQIGFGQDVGKCRSCYWLLETSHRQPWCQLYDLVAGETECAGYFFIQPDGEE